MTLEKILTFGKFTTDECYYGRVVLMCKKCGGCYDFISLISKGNIRKCIFLFAFIFL
jgi:hypothetical protein